MRNIKGSKGITPNMVYRLVKDTVAAAADELAASSQLSAAKLRRASVHWFRHMAITHGDDAGIGMKYLSLSARHEKLETTAIYQHAEDAKWHREWQRHRF